MLRPTTRYMIPKKKKLNQNRLVINERRSPFPKRLENHFSFRRHSTFHFAQQISLNIVPLRYQLRGKALSQIDY